jgi:hypothetical protein
MLNRQFCLAIGRLVILMAATVILTPSSSVAQMQGCVQCGTFCNGLGTCFPVCVGGGTGAACFTPGNGCVSFGACQVGGGSYGGNQC